MPFDVIKTRMQSLAAKTEYKNLFHCGWRIVKEEGVATLWKGTVPRLARLSVSLSLLRSPFARFLQSIGVTRSLQWIADLPPSLSADVGRYRLLRLRVGHRRHFTPQLELPSGLHLPLGQIGRERLGLKGSSRVCETPQLSFSPATRCRRRLRCLHATVLRAPACHPSTPTHCRHRFSFAAPVPSQPIDECCCSSCQMHTETMQA